MQGLAGIFWLIGYVLGLGVRGIMAKFRHPEKSNRYQASSQHGEIHIGTLRKVLVEHGSKTHLNTKPCTLNSHFRWSAYVSMVGALQAVWQLHQPMGLMLCMGGPYSQTSWQAFCKLFDTCLPKSSAPYPKESPRVLHNISSGV